MRAYQPVASSVTGSPRWSSASTFDREGAGHLGQVAGHAEAALGEEGRAGVDHGEVGVGDDVEGDRPAAQLGQLARRQPLVVFGPVLDHRELHRLADLRRRQPDRRAPRASSPACASISSAMRGLRSSSGVSHAHLTGTRISAGSTTPGFHHTGRPAASWAVRIHRARVS